MATLHGAVQCDSNMRSHNFKYRECGSCRAPNAPVNYECQGNHYCDEECQRNRSEVHRESCTYLLFKDIARKCKELQVLTATSSSRNRIKWVACMRDVGCTHPGFAPYRARVQRASVAQKSVACIRLNGLSGLRASVFKKTLACIRFRNVPCVHPFSSH